MPARRTKSGRFKKSTRRRTYKKKINLTNLAVSALVANKITEGVFRSNLVDFFTGRKDGKWAAGADGSLRLTLPEILGFGAGGFGGNYSAASGLDFGSTVARNFKENAASIIGTAILVPMAANVITKVLKKPVILPMNRALKMTGLDVKV